MHEEKKVTFTAKSRENNTDPITMKLNAEKFNIKQAVKVLGGSLLLYLVYLNIILPVVLSAQQIYLIAGNIVIVSHKKNIDLKDISLKQLEETYNLAIDRVIKVFKTNGFRLVPHAIAGTSGS